MGEVAAEGAGRTRVLALSSTSFTVMFAVWLMFGILGKPISTEFGISRCSSPGSSRSPSSTAPCGGSRRA